jgi:hypothetical protein
MNAFDSAFSERFARFAAGFVLFAWSAYALGTAGLFSRGAVLALTMIAAAGIGTTLFRWLAIETITARAVFVLSIVFSAFLLSGTFPSVFSGRDQGAIAEAAIGLSETGRFELPSPVDGLFFDLRGPGKALNFPGFFFDDDGSLLTQFPRSSVAWFGAFHSLFGISGLVAANGVTLVLSLLSIFVLVRTLSDERTAVGAILIAAASFLPTWFAKFTLTENLALFLFLLLSLSLVLFLSKPGKTSFFAAVVSALLLAVTRIEGLAILAIAVTIPFLARSGRAFLHALSPISRVATVAIGATALATDLVGNLPHYVSIAKAILPDGNTVSATAASLLPSLPFWKLFLPYGFLPILLLGIAGLIILLIRRDRIALLPLLLALPTLLYLVAPNISADHPWMFRRLLSSVWPALLVTGAVGIGSAFRKMDGIGGRIAFGILLSVAVAGLDPTIRAFGFSENGHLAEGILKLSESVGNRDLLLVDRTATGDPYAMIDGPLRFLYGKDAAYLFDPSDIAAIPSGRYDRILFLSPDIGHEPWDRIPGLPVPVSTFRFRLDRLGPLPLNEPCFPEISTDITESTLYEIDTL